MAAELGYRPNPHARALLSGRHHTVAMVVSDITNPHYFELIRGAEMRAKASEYTLVLVNAEESPRIEYDQIQRLVPSVDGFVLAASRLPDENLEQIAAQRPIVLMNRELSGLPSVVLDHVQGCRQIVEHLASLGHRDLVYLAGPRNSWMATTRWSALRKAARDLGVRAAPDRTVHAQGLPGRRGCGRRPAHSGATAIVAHNDLLAIGVVQRLAQRSVRVPRGRQRGRLRQHLRRRPVHTESDHPGRRPCGGRACGRGAPARHVGPDSESIRGAAGRSPRGAGASGLDRGARFLRGLRPRPSRSQGARNQRQPGQEGGSSRTRDAIANAELAAGTPQ